MKTKIIFFVVVVFFWNRTWRIELRGDCGGRGKEIPVVRPAPHKPISQKERKRCHTKEKTRACMRGVEGPSQAKPNQVAHAPSMREAPSLPPHHKGVWRDDVSFHRLANAKWDQSTKKKERKRNLASTVPMGRGGGFTAHNERRPPPPVTIHPDLIRGCQGKVGREDSAGGHPQPPSRISSTLTHTHTHTHTPCAPLCITLIPFYRFDWLHEFSGFCSCA